MVSLVWVSLVVSMVAATPVFQDCSQHISCLDCHTLQICHPHSTNVTRVDCRQTGLPFCNHTSSSCSAAPTPSCTPEDSFLCLSDGYFPDSDDCHAFHLCVEFKATRFQCDPSLPSYYYYDVVLHRCVQSAICGYSCAGKSGVKTPHPADKKLYAFCLNGSVTFQDRCHGNYELDEKSQVCVAICKTQGLQPDLHHCRKFYRCISNGGGYWMRHEQCPDGQGFNPVTLRCEDGLPFCQGAGPSTPTPSSTTPSDPTTKMATTTEPPANARTSAL